MCRTSARWSNIRGSGGRVQAARGGLRRVRRTCHSGARTTPPTSPALPRLPLGAGLERGPAVRVVLEGRAVQAFRGETVATVLLAEGHVATRTTPSGEPRGVFCGMGVCFDCLVVVDGVPNTRACTTLVTDGLEVSRQAGWTAVEPQ